jgi:hypothetical protein
MAVPPVFSGLRHPERSQRERTRREDRHFKFYEIPDNLATVLRLSISGPVADGPIKPISTPARSGLAG